MSDFLTGAEPSPMPKFRAAARKIERSIARYAEGGDREEREALSRAINRLDDRTNKPEIRGVEAYREEAVKKLRASLEPAEEAAHKARQAGRLRENEALEEKERARRAAMDPALRAYQDELLLMRGR